MEKYLHLSSSSISCYKALFFFWFLLTHPRQPQARQASPSISMSPMGQWMRWFPTCLGEPRRTEASWRVPKRRGSCCGRSWNADLPLGSFSTDRYTENTEEETKRRVCQPVEFFSFFVILFFFYLAWLTAAAVAVCSLSLHQYCSPWVYISCSNLSWSSLADGLFSAGHCLFLSSRHCFSPFCSLLSFPTSNPHPYFCALPVFSLFLFLIHLCIHKYPSFCLHIVYRALVSIKWTSLLLQKDSLKCQRDPGGWAALFITLFILERDNNNKNNRLDLNGSKGTINILLLNYVIIFFFLLFYSWTTTQSPEEAALYCIFVCCGRGCIASLKTLPVYKSVRKYKRFLAAHPCFSKSERLLLLYLPEEVIFLVTEVLNERMYSVQYSARESPFNADTCISARL